MDMILSDMGIDYVSFCTLTTLHRRQVVPWLELAHDQGQNLNAAQYGHEAGLPRVFKTHAWQGHCPKGVL